MAWSQGSAGAAKEENSKSSKELIFKTINFAILVGGLGYVLRKPLGEFFRSRSASIQKSLEEGRKALESLPSSTEVGGRKAAGTGSRNCRL